MTSFFTDRGCSATAVDARETNLRVLVRRLPMVATELVDLDMVATELVDLDHPNDALQGRRFDVMFCYDTLMLVADQRRALEWLADRCDDQLPLELWVSASDVTQLATDTTSAREGLHACACAPELATVEGWLQELFPPVWKPASQPLDPTFDVLRDPRRVVLLPSRDGASSSTCQRASDAGVQG